MTMTANSQNASSFGLSTFTSVRILELGDSQVSFTGGKSVLQPNARMLQLRKRFASMFFGVREAGGPKQVLARAKQPLWCCTPRWSRQITPCHDGQFGVFMLLGYAPSNDPASPYSYMCSFFLKISFDFFAKHMYSVHKLHTQPYIKVVLSY
jgi:hypothetical protein